MPIQRTVRPHSSIAYAAWLAVAVALAGCYDELPLEPPVAAGPARGALASVALVESGEFRALTYNVHGIIDAVPGSIGEFITEYTAAISRMLDIGPLLNGYDHVAIQENFVARLTLDFGFVKLRIRLDGLYRGLDHQTAHPFRSGYQRPTPPSVPPPTDFDVAFSDGLVRFSNFSFAPQDYSRQTWFSCNGNDCFTNKGFTLARTRLPATTGFSVDIYNLHMNAGSSEADLEARWDQMVQLADVIASTSAGRAVIVAGDFNLNPFSTNPLRAGRDGEILEELLERTGLADACTAVSADACDATLVDRFLYRPQTPNGETILELEPLAWVANGAGTPFDGLSDHKAIEVKFAWRVWGEMSSRW